MLKTLDKILLGNNVVEDFYTEYNNLEFRQWLTSVMPEIEDCKNLKHKGSTAKHPYDDF